MNHLNRSNLSNHFDDRPDASPEADLAQGFAAHAVSWARDAGAPDACLPLLREAATRVSLAVAAGHVCVPLAQLASPQQTIAAWRDALLASGVVGTAADEPAAPRPLLLDASDRLYLRRHFDWERRLANALVRRAAAAPAPISPEACGRLDELFAANAARLDGRVDWQKLAVALALERRLTIISGGPGTGKTTTVAALLGCLLSAEPTLRIALAAPTGKAAARMLDALRARAATLPAAVRERLPQTSYTLHRLLGVTPQPGRFRHHAGYPLALDVLVVDEASMLDLALATRLVDALPPAARLILLGDKDQLAAVEAGAVFAELCADPSLSAACVARLAAHTGIPAARIVPPSQRVQQVQTVPAGDAGQPEPSESPVAAPLADSVVWFAESHRFAADSGIGRLAAGINAGAGEDVLAWLQEAGDPSVAWLDDETGMLSAGTFARMEAGYAGYLDALRAHADGGDPAPVFAAFDRFRVLCAVHAGPRGIDAINDRLSRHARGALAHPRDPGPPSPWYPGRPVIVLRNDYVLRLYNGDVGICLPDVDGELRIVFAESAGGWRELAPLRLPAHDTAFALTVHKSQGSEFAEVLLVLPAAPAKVMSRELLYTAATRAAHRVTLAGSRAAFIAACDSPTTRHSGLLDRMREGPQPD